MSDTASACCIFDIHQPILIIFVDNKVHDIMFSVQILFLTWPFLPRDSYAKRGICRRRVSVCVSVCLSVCVCLSHSGIVSKRLNVGSRKERRTIAP